jgi:hypothetical protein
LRAGAIDGAAHQAIERIDLSDQMAFAQTADRGVARHHADGGHTVSHQEGARTHARCRGRRLAARVSSSNDDDI